MQRLTAQQKSCIIDNAVNAYFHQAIAELEKKTLGDIERKQWEIVKERCKQFFYDIEFPTTPIEPDSLQGYTLEHMKAAFNKGVDSAEPDVTNPPNYFATLIESIKLPGNSLQGENKRLREALENLQQAVPGQTNDADWWSDELREAMEAANNLLDSLSTSNPTGEPGK